MKQQTMEQIIKYHFIEMTFPTAGSVKGCFKQKDIGAVKTVYGFLKGPCQTALRFMPDAEGVWDYEIHGEDGIMASGCFQCMPAQENNHGPVRAGDCVFHYDDGTRFLPFGTTCYAWAHQPEELRRQTLQTLGESPFNKVRMLVFPKDMIYNQNEPPFLPFEKTQEGWDVNRPVFAYWDNLERCIAALGGMGIEADLILFHPYDRWGLAELSPEQSESYTRYLIDRFGAYRNVWWSLANEYDLVGSKGQEDWEAIARLLRERDPYGHLCSIHHCINMYPKRGWMTHVSAQTGDTGKTLAYRHTYGLPVVIDECGYEGDIEFGWGNLSPRELTHRIWTAVIRGGYATHGETFYREDEVLWWAKGGQLHGESPARAAFLRDLLESLEGILQPRLEFVSSDPNGRKEAEENPFAKAMMKLPEAQREEQILQLLPPVISNRRHILQYLGKACQAWINLPLPEGEWRIEVIDTWEMTRSAAAERAQGTVRIELPGKEGMAVLASRQAI